MELKKGSHRIRDGMTLVQSNLGTMGQPWNAVGRFLLLIFLILNDLSLTLASPLPRSPGVVDTTRNEASQTSNSAVDSTRQFYNRHVSQYVSNVEKAGCSHIPHSHYETFVRSLQLEFPDTELSRIKVVELGCGYGRDVAYFSRNWGMQNILGTDFSSGMLERAQSLVPHAFFVELDMRRIGQLLVPNSVQGIWASATILHVPKRDLPGLLSSLHRILQPGGILYLSVKQGLGETFDADDRYGGIPKFYAYYSSEEFLQHLRHAGFEIVESGVDDARDRDTYATHPFLHVFAMKPNPPTRSEKDG